MAISSTLPVPVLLAAALLIGCGGKDSGGTGTGTGTDTGSTATDGGGTTDAGTADGGTSATSTDADADGYSSEFDCDDDNADVNPGAAELCNGIDDNCDGVIDDDAVDRISLYEDQDEDGYGNPLASITACPGDAVKGYVTDNQDCRDSDPEINPDGHEVCDDMNFDEDCDGLRDDADDSTDTLSMSTFFADYDLDGFGDPATLVHGCDAGDIRSLNELDCDDSDPNVGPDSSCAPFDGVWTGAVDFDVGGLYYSGTCTDTGSVTISDASSNQVSGTIVCNYYVSYGYSYYPVTLSLHGQIDYPWGVSGYWTDTQYWFAESTGSDTSDSSLWLTSFDGEFSEDGTLTLQLTGAHDGLFGSYDVSLDGPWVLNQ